LKTLLQFIYEHEKNLADRIWLTQPMGDGVLRTFTWKEAIDEARRMATYLRDRGYPPGTRIAILSRNCAWWFLSDLAIWMAGHVSVPVYPTLTADSVRTILEHSETKLVFVGKLDGFAEMEPGIPSGIDRVSYPISPDGAGVSWTDIVSRAQPIAGAPDRDPDEMVTIMYTSGTTGKPKGVMHSFRTMNHSRTFCEIGGFSPDDRCVSYLPLSHVAERALLETTCLMVGFSIWFVDKLETFVQDVQRARPTVFGSVPRLWTQFQAGVFAKVPAQRLDRLQVQSLAQVPHGRDCQDQQQRKAGHQRGNGDTSSDVHAIDEAGEVSRAQPGANRQAHSKRDRHRHGEFARDHASDCRVIRAVKSMQDQFGATATQRVGNQRVRSQHRDSNRQQRDGSQHRRHLLFHLVHRRTQRISGFDRVRQSRAVRFP